MEKERLCPRIATLGLTVVVGLTLTCLLLLGMALTGEPAQASTQPQEGMNEGLPVAPPDDSGDGGVGPMYAQGVVTGRVTARCPTGLPQANVHVEFYDVSIANSITSTTTDSNGHYSATVTAEGDAVKVRFVFTGFSDMYYDGESTWESADVVAVTPGGTVTNINAALNQNFTITGLVTDADTTNPLSSATVSIYDASSHASITSTLSGASGTYTVDMVTSTCTDTYKAGFRRTEYGSQYYAYVTTITGATVLTQGGASTIPNINAALGPGTGCITGTVVAASNAEPVPAVTVTVSLPKSDLVPFTKTKAFTVTDISGSYRVCGLEGYYRVGFDKSLFVPQWYDDKPALNAADTVTVTTAQTTTHVNAALVLGGCLAGKVVDSEGITVPTAVVTVYNSSAQIVGVPIPPPPASDETYRVCQLASGLHTVQCFDGTWYGQVTAVVTAPQNTLGVICTVEPRYTYMPIIWRNSQ